MEGNNIEPLTIKGISRSDFNPVNALCRVAGRRCNGSVVMPPSIIDTLGLGIKICESKGL